MNIIKTLLDLPNKVKRYRFLQDYSLWLEDVKNNKSFFVPLTEDKYVRKPDDVKIFAYYLPQYYPIPENDAAHGLGFTDWNNVTSCFPHFIGQYQPKLPYDIGFYNPLTPGVMERQAELAKTYGIYGFCFYYYWFSGKKVLEKPLEYWLHSNIDFHYHFCWANENWSKLWDGGNKEVILEQRLVEGDADRFYADIRPYILDYRYEKIDNKPILMIYKPQLFERSLFVGFVHRINELARNDSFNGFYLMANQTGEVNPLEYDMDALTEFPPHGMIGECEGINNVQHLLKNTRFSVLSTTNYINQKHYLYEREYTVYKTCFPSWDNLPRKAWTDGFSFKINDEEFESWLKGIIRWTKINHDSDKQYVYINAWNEWAEGAMLEPTQRYGYKYLQIVRKCIEESRNFVN